MIRISPPFNYLPLFSSANYPTQRTFIFILSILLFTLITHMGIYYISVVFELLCPNSSWIYRRSVPLPSRCLISLSFPMLHPKASRSDLFFSFHLLCEWVFSQRQYPPTPISPPHSLLTPRNNISIKIALCFKLLTDERIWETSSWLKTTGNFLSFHFLRLFIS